MICLFSSTESLDLDSLLIKVQGQVSSHWYQFGLAIGTPEDIMEQLKDYSEMDGLVEILDYWLRHHPGQPTWREVADALRKAELMNDHDLAKDCMQTT